MLAQFVNTKKNKTLCCINEYHHSEKRVKYKHYRAVKNNPKQTYKHQIFQPLNQTAYKQGVSKGFRNDIQTRLQFDNSILATSPSNEVTTTTRIS